MSQGKELTYEQKVAIVQVKTYMDNEKAQGKEASTQNPALRTARALDISLSTVKQVLAAANKNQGVVARRTPQPRGHPPVKIRTHEVAMVRQMVQDAHLRGEMVYVPKLQTWLKEQGTVVATSTLRRALLRMGFSYGHASRRSALKEREDVIANRRAYLAALRANRDQQGPTIRPEIDMDETFVHVNHHKRFTWNEEGTLVNMPSGVGARLMIVDAIIQDDRGKTYGWVPGAHLHFKSGLRTGDDHGAMHFENFRKWMETQLLPNSPSHSLLIFDHAPYPNTLTEETFPQSSTKKAQLQQWLHKHHVPFDDWLLKPALYERCRQHAPPPEYAIDRLAAQWGCDILRTSPSCPIRIISTSFRTGR